MDNIYEEIILVKEKPLFEEFIQIENHKIYYKYTSQKYYAYIYDILDILCKKCPYENSSSIFHLSLNFILKILYQCGNVPYLSNLDLIVLNCFSLGAKCIIKQTSFPSINRIKKIYEEKYNNYNNEEIFEGEIICLKLLNYDINILTAYEYITYLTQNDLKLKELCLSNLEYIIKNNIEQYVYRSSFDIALDCVVDVKEKMIFKEPKIIKKKIISSSGFCYNSPIIKKYASKDKIASSINEYNKKNKTNEGLKQRVKKINNFTRPKLSFVLIKKINLLDNNIINLKNSADRVYQKKNCSTKANPYSSISLVSESNLSNYNINSRSRKPLYTKLNKSNINRFIYNNNVCNEINIEKSKKKSIDINKSEIYHKNINLMKNDLEYFDNKSDKFNIKQSFNDNQNKNNKNDINASKENDQNYANLYLQKNNNDTNNNIYERKTKKQKTSTYNSFLKGVKTKIESKNIYLGTLTKNNNCKANFQRNNVINKKEENKGKNNCFSIYNSSIGSKDGNYLSNETIGNCYVRW